MATNEQIAAEQHNQRVLLEHIINTLQRENSDVYHIRHDVGTVRDMVAVDAEREAKTATAPERFKRWAANNLAWILTTLFGAFVAFIQLRDEYRDHKRETDAALRKAQSSTDSAAESIASHVEVADRRIQDLETGLSETQFLILEATDQIQREIRSVHGNRRMPDESKALRAARKRIEQQRAERLNP